MRGIRIVPELDSPAHLASWALAPEAAPLINCTVNYNGDLGTPLGMINPTLNATYELVGGLFNDLEYYFPWDQMHLGCDEVTDMCWDNSEINNWMVENNVTSYNQLFNYYVENIKTLKSSNKTAMFWSAEVTEFLEFTDNDILQFWDDTSVLPQHLGVYPNNRFVLSPSNALYLDCGLGSPDGSDSWCGDYQTWLMIYQFEPTQVVPSEYNSNVIGLEVCQWDEMNDDATILNRIFPRASALGERVWSPLANQYNNTLSVFQRLNAWRVRAQTRGIPAQPLSSGYCEQHSSACFSTSSNGMQGKGLFW